MKYTEGKAGRVFIVQLENGDVIPDSIETFAAEQNIKVAYVTIVGGVCTGNVVVGPRDTGANKPEPILLPVNEAHEIMATGIIAPSEEGIPILHIHGALGRAGNTLSGCLRPGIETWLTGEAVVQEITGVDAKRLLDRESGFKLLQLQSSHKG
jgi:predicted DNA-binding protein with PD1-like motif